MRYEFEVPDDLTLRGLEQTSRGFMAYVGPKGSLYLQGMIGGTPQEAIDSAVHRVRSSLERIEEQRSLALVISRSNNTLTLDDLDF